MSEVVWKAVAAAVAGAFAAGLMTWTAAALTLTGRVTAIEKSLERIEAHLYGSSPTVARAPVKP